MKKKKVTVTKEYIDSLKEQIKSLEADELKMRQDRNKFREFFLQLLKDNASMAAKNQYYSAETMVVKLGKLMNQVENWYWG